MRFIGCLRHPPSNSGGPARSRPQTGQHSGWVRLRPQSQSIPDPHQTPPRARGASGQVDGPRPVPWPEARSGPAAATGHAPTRHQRTGGDARRLPPDVRVAFEPRHASWHVDEVATLLRSRNAAFSLTDTPARRSPFWRTADWGYVRFHEGRSAPHPCYGRAALRTWAERLRDLWGPDEDVYAYFNNDHGGCAVRDAHRFALEIARAGRTPSPVPTAREAPLTTR